MFRNKVFLVFCLALVAACADPNGRPLDLGADETSDSGDGFDESVEPVLDVAPPPGSLDPADDPEPVDRIVWAVDDDGDIVVEATVTAEVLEVFPDAYRYRLRIAADRSTTLVSVVDADEEVIQSFRTRRGASRYYPELDAAIVEFPASAPSVEACALAPCNWTDGEPPVDGDHFEISQRDGITHMHGMVTGHGIYEHYMLDPVSEEPIGVAHQRSEATHARLQQMDVVFHDVMLLLPEVEAIEDDCLWCSLGSLGVIISAGQCFSGNYAQCGNAVVEGDVWLDECPGACG